MAKFIRDTLSTYTGLAKYYRQRLKDTDSAVATTVGASLYCLGFIAAVCGILAISTFFVWVAWNRFLTPIFGVPEMSYFQAFMLLAVTYVLTKSSHIFANSSSKNNPSTGG